MKTLQLLLPILMVCGLSAARGEWKLKVHDEQVIVLHEWNKEEEEAPSIKGLAELLASREPELPPKHITFWTYFNNDRTIQSEVLAEFKTRYPNLLNAAFKSSGNMHNPKVLPLRSKFSECLLATPTLAKINAVLNECGYAITEISFEKFWIDKSNERMPFHAIIWLIPEQSQNEEAQQVGAGQPATRSESDAEGRDKPQPESEGNPRSRVPSL